jgi:tellurite resistance protein TehA-like permease
MHEKRDSFGASGLFRQWLDREVATLDPGCFALIMATGIISNALFVEGHRTLSDSLLVVGIAAYCLLLVLLTWRFFKFGPALWADIINPRFAFSFLTLVASTDVLGVGLDLRAFNELARVAWLLALALWVVLTYLGFGTLTFLNDGDGVNIIDGGWLIAIVATQSLVILGARVASGSQDAGPAFFVLIHVLWGTGLALYGIFIALLANRLFFSNVAPDDVTPVLWVVMGAAAISANAGSTLLLRPSQMPFLQSMRPFLSSATLFMWAWATWWIPFLLLLGIWKHWVRHVPVTYTPLYWSLVFPLGMYSVASLRLSRVANFQPLLLLAHAVAWVALAAWVVAAAGLIVTSTRSLQNFLQSRAATRRGNFAR